MGCGCVVRNGTGGNGILLARPRMFLTNLSESEFVRSLGPEEVKDKKRLLAFFQHLHEGQFQVTPRFRELVRKDGVPWRYRWLAWRALSCYSSIHKSSIHERIAQRSMDPKTVELYMKDLDRTFPSIEEFDDDHKGHLATMLEWYARLFPEVGYCQGMNFVAGFLLLVGTSQEEAFFMLYLLMVRYQANLLFCDGLPLLKLYTFQFQSLLETLFPEVHKHFLKSNITPELYATRWMLTVFTQALPFAAATRVWDLVICDGLEAVILIALANVKLLRSRLLREDTEGILELLSLKADGRLPSGGSIVRTALRLGGSDKFATLRSRWAADFPEDAAMLERNKRLLCSDHEDAIELMREVPPPEGGEQWASIVPTPEVPTPEAPTAQLISRRIALEVDEHEFAAEFEEGDTDMRHMVTSIAPTACFIIDRHDDFVGSIGLHSTANVSVGNGAISAAPVQTEVQPAVTVESVETTDVIAACNVSSLPARMLSETHDLQTSGSDARSENEDGSPHIVAAETKLALKPLPPCQRPASVRRKEHPASQPPVRNVGRSRTWDNPTGSYPESIGHLPCLLSSGLPAMNSADSAVATTDASRLRLPVLVSGASSHLANSVHSEFAQTVPSACSQDSKSMTCNQENSKPMPIHVMATTGSENHRPSSFSEVRGDTWRSETACIDMVGSQGPQPSWTQPPVEECTRSCSSRSSDVPYSALRERRPVHARTPGINTLPTGQAMPNCNSSVARSLSPLRAHTPVPSPSPSPPVQPLRQKQQNSTGRMQFCSQTALSKQMHLQDQEVIPHRGPPALERWHCSNFSYGALRSFSVGNRSDAFHVGRCNTSAGSARHKNVPCTAQQDADELRQGLGSALHQSNFAGITNIRSANEAPCSPDAAKLLLEAAMGGSRPRAETNGLQPEPVADSLAPPADGIPDAGLQVADALGAEADDGTFALNLRSTSTICHSSLSKSALPPPARTQVPRRRRMKREGVEAHCATAG